MHPRRKLLALAALAAFAPAHLVAQAVRRVGVLMPLPADDPEVKQRIAAFTQALRGLGWAEGRNLHIEYRYAPGDAAKLKEHGAELVAMKPDLLVVHSNQALALMRH